MIPVTILTGFLGSGKTTLLNHIIRQGYEENIAVLLNDFGAVDIDSELVVSVEGETLALSGGCICCTIRADLEETILDLIQNDQPPRRLIIEASGVSDPAAVAMTFFNGRLRGRCRVESIITMIDGEMFYDMDASMKPLIHAQLNVADLVVLNKMDICSEATMQRIENEIRSTYPKARFLRTSFAKVPHALLFGIPIDDDDQDTMVSCIETHTHNLGEDHDHDHPNHAFIFDTWTFRENEPMNRYRLMKELANLPSDIYRAKGFVYAKDVPDHEVVVHVAGRRVYQFRGKPWDTKERQTRLVFIGKHGKLDPDTIRQRLLACNLPKPKAQVPEGAPEFMARFESLLRLVKKPD